MAPTYLTEQDLRDYGSDLIDVTQRAALHALSPELQEIRQQNAELQRRLAQEQRHRLDQQIERALPDFRERDRDPRWHEWLRGTDILSGRVRQQLLNEATASGNPERVLAFFRSYQREAGGTRMLLRRHLAGQGLRRPASPAIPASRSANCTRRTAKAHMSARDQEWARIENDIFAAQREGRVQGLPYLTK